MWKHLRYWGFKSFGMWCCVTGQVVSHILKDHVAFRPSRNGLQCLVTEDYRRVYGSQKMTKRQYHRTLCTPIKSFYDASGIRQFMYSSRSQTDFMSITRVLAQLSTQLFHMTNLHMNESKDLCPWPRYWLDDNKALCIYFGLRFWHEIFKITPNSLSGDTLSLDFFPSCDVLS